MNKVILKTALITILSLVAAFIVGVVCIYVFAPRVAGNYCYELGLKNMATECYERVYEKSGDFDDLVELVNSAIYAEDDGVVAVYGEEMVKREVEFKNFCDLSDEELEDVEFTTYDYYFNSTMFAKYALGNKRDATKLAFFGVINGEYNENSALKMLVNMIKTDEDLGNLLKEEYLNLGEKQWFAQFDEFRKDMKNVGYPIS